MYFFPLRKYVHKINNLSQSYCGLPSLSHPKHFILLSFLCLELFSRGEGGMERPVLNEYLVHYVTEYNLSEVSLVVRIKRQD